MMEETEKPGELKRGKNWGTEKKREEEGGKRPGGYGKGAELEGKG